MRGSVTVPLSSVASVRVVDRPLSKQPVQSVRMGSAAAGAPLSKLAMIGPRATFRDGKALVVIWGNRRALVLELGDGAGEWRLIAVSGRDVDRAASQLSATR